jgi:class I fructose-bisphosphate aldolase/fructose-bisphosphate aldolase/2-amino-3,7-dideoxy-D-threo-hept-6-ulosonate synthase
MSGKDIRLKRLFPTPDHSLFSVPLDHSLTMGPIAGLETLPPLARRLQEGGVTALIVHKGAVKSLQPVLQPHTLLGIHLSASTTLAEDPSWKYRAGTVGEAVRLGADFVSVQVNFGVPGEGEMLRDLGTVAEETAALGLPLLCMAYVKKKGKEYDPEAVAHACRAAADLGADIVKTSFTGAESFRKVVSSVHVPVLVGGGQKLSSKEDLLHLVSDSLKAGARGICIGRNLFQDADVTGLCGEVASILRGGAGTRSD